MAREERSLTHAPPRPRDGAAQALATFFIIAFAVVLADGLRLGECGPLADDWDQVGKLVWGGEADRTIHDQFLLGGEGRPLRALDQTLIVLAHRLGGLTSVYALLLVVTAASGFLVAMVASRRLSRPLAVLAGLLFVLNPADTTHLWAATLNARLGIFFALSAAWAFTKDRPALAYVGCVAALFSYETSVLAFALAPWTTDGGRVKTVMKGAGVALAAGATYFAWRLFVLARMTADYRLGTFGFGSERTTEDRIADVFHSVPLMIGSWPKRAAEVVIERDLPQGWWWVVGLLSLPLILVVVRGGAPRAAREHPLATTGHTLLLTLAAALAAIVRPPMVSLSVESRYNLALVPAASLLAVALLSLTGRALPERWRVAARVPAVMLLLMLLAFRMHLRDDYVEAAVHQRQVVTSCVEAIGPLPPHTVVILSSPHAGYDARERAIVPFVTGFDFELAPMFGLLYDASILAAAHGDARDIERGRIDATGQLLAERPLRCSVVAYDVASGEATWLHRGPLGTGAPLSADGPALEYLRRR